MNLKLKKVLRVTSKVVLILVGVCLFLYFGFITFLSIFFDPHDVRLTNITDSSMTISWITNYPMKGIVYYKDSDSFLPGPLSWIGSNKAVDDRDMALAQAKCVEEYNKEHKVSSDFVVDTSNYDCTDIEVSEYGGYFTHHVTLKNLDSNKMYYFRVGDGYFSWKKDIDSSATFYALDKEVDTPNPIYGKIVNEGGEYIDDSVVYIKFTNAYTGKESMYYSSATNENGGWYLDGNNIRTIEGEPMLVENGQDMIIVYAQYQNYLLSEGHKWVYGSTDVGYPDIVVSEEWEKDLSQKERGTGGVYSAYAGTLDDYIYQKTQQTTIPDTVRKEVLDQSYQNQPTEKVEKAVAKVENNQITEEKQNEERQESRQRNPVAEGTITTSTPNITQQEITSTYGISASDWEKLKNGDAEVAARVGYGNAAKALARGTNNGVLDSTVLDKIGLGGSDVVIAGNLSAIWGGGEGKGVFAKEVSDAAGTGSSVALKFDGTSWSKQTIKGGGGGTGPDGTGNLEDNKGNVLTIVYPENNVPYYITSLLSGSNDITKKCVNGECTLSFSLTSLDYNKLLLDAVAHDSGEFATTILTLLDKNKEKVFGGKDSIILEYNGGKIVMDKDFTSEDYNKLGLKGTEKITVTDELKLIYPELAGDEEITALDLKNLITKREEVISAYDKAFSDEELKDLCANITCEEGKKCSNGECIEEPNKLEGGKYLDDINMIGKSSNESCQEEGGCKCIYSDVSIGVARGEACLSENKLEYLLDYAAGTVGDYDLVYDYVNELYNNRATILNDEYDKAKDSYDKLKEEKRMLGGTPTERQVIEINNALTEAKETLDEISKERDALKQEKQQVINNVLSKPCEGSSIIDYSNCIGLDVIDTGENIGEKDNVQGVSDPTVLGTSTSNSGYIYYLPEYGIYDIEVTGLKETERVGGDESNLHIFYVEMNGVSGLQLPVDPENPQVGEDLILRSDSLEIKYKEVAEPNTLNIKKGINIVSFGYIPVLNTENSSKASAMLEWFAKKNADVDHISYFEGGRWKGIGYVNGEIIGNDFTIIPGKGYLLYSEADKTVVIPGYDITESIPVPLSSGWNLVGIHGYSKVYTARSLLNSINKVEGLTANNISWWPTSKGKYEGLQLSDGKEYGFDFPISPNNGYFIRINKFEPKDTSCGSILWNEGGTHNGACGNSKTL